MLACVPNILSLNFCERVYTNVKRVRSVGEYDLEILTDHYKAVVKAGIVGLCRDGISEVRRADTEGRV